MRALASASAGPRSHGIKQPNSAASNMRYPMPRGRGLAMTRPSWASPEAFASLLGEHSAAAMAEQEREAELRALVTDSGGDGTDAPSAPPVVTPILSRTLVLKNAFNPKRLAKNPYVQNAADDDAGPPVFPDVEKYYISLCCQFGYVRYASARVGEDGTCLVKVGFATKEGAKNCIDALHGMPMAWQQQLVADYDLIGEAAKSVSKAIWIGNVFAPFTCKEELEETEAEAALRGRPPYLAEMESDFTCECSRFGPVTRVVASASEGAVHVVFGSVVSAADCGSAMNGRWFEERLMWAEFDLDFDEDYIREEAASANAQNAGSTPPPHMGTAAAAEEDEDDDDDRRYRSSSSSSISKSSSYVDSDCSSIMKRSVPSEDEYASSKRPFKAATLETTATVRRTTTEAPEKDGLKTVALPASLLATFAPTTTSSNTSAFAGSSSSVRKNVIGGNRDEKRSAQGRGSLFGLLPSSSSASPAPVLNPYASLAHVRPPSSASLRSPTTAPSSARPPTPPRPSITKTAHPGSVTNAFSDSGASAATADSSFPSSSTLFLAPSSTTADELPSATSSSSCGTPSLMLSFSSYAAVTQQDEKAVDGGAPKNGTDGGPSALLLGLAGYGSDDDSS